MNKKGFTLIELLAVIVILAIIALIATPIVLNSIENAQEGAAERTTENYIDAVETKVASTLLNGKKLEGTYTIQTDGNLCPEGTTCDDNTEIKIDMGGKKPSSGTIVIENGQVTNASTITVGDYTVAYDYDKESYVATKDGETEPLSFTDDSWDTISKNVKEGKGYLYQVGDTKEVTLDGFGTFTIRIANTSTPAKCSTEGFSQTACGFVIEFEDIITERYMNYGTISYDGGWEASDMRTYVNDTILKSLPSDLQNVIIDTKVVSGHGSNSWERNFITADKLYLLSTKEVWGENSLADTAKAETRQLDYYENKEVSTSNYSGAIKQYNGSDRAWSLRSAHSDDRILYHLVTTGWWNSATGQTFAENENGVAPAFRIG